MASYLNLTHLSKTYIKDAFVSIIQNIFLPKQKTLNEMQNRNSFLKTLQQNRNIDSMVFVYLKPASLCIKSVVCMHSMNIKKNLFSFILLTQICCSPLFPSASILDCVVYMNKKGKNTLNHSDWIQNEVHPVNKEIKKITPALLSLYCFFVYVRFCCIEIYLKVHTWVFEFNINLVRRCNNKTTYLYTGISWHLSIQSSLYYTTYFLYKYNTRQREFCWYIYLK